MRNIRCKIKLMGSFAPYRDRLIFGLDHMDILKEKLKKLGISISIDAKVEIPEDIFYLEEQQILRFARKRKTPYFPIKDDVDYYKAMCEIKRYINFKLIHKGVQILNVDNTYVDGNANIGSGTLIYPETFIEGECEIGKDCVLGPNTRLVDCVVGDQTTIINSTVLESTIGEKCNIGPYAYVRPETVIEDKVKIGDFVEIKKSKIGKESKIPHLAYVGDTTVGENTNIACGVITANYDGTIKHQTVIGDHCFVGCNTTLVSPVRVEEDSYIAAGSTITEDVKSDSLAIARQRQVEKPGWVSKTGHSRKKK